MKWKIGALLVVGVAAVTVGLSLFVTGYWSTDVSESTGTVAAVSESESDGLHDTAEIHGDWEIEVRDPDGTLVASTAFSNALSSYAKGRLALGLRGLSTGLSNWWVVLGSTGMMGQNDPCQGGIACRLSTTGTTNIDPEGTIPAMQGGLTISGITGGSPGVKLSGSYVAGDPPGSATGGNLTQVHTYAGANQSAGTLFSSATFSGVPFTKGQTINVTVNITIN